MLRGGRKDIHVDRRSLKQREVYGPPVVVIHETGHQERGDHVIIHGQVEVVSDGPRVWLITRAPVTVRGPEQPPAPLKWR